MYSIKGFFDKIDETGAREVHFENIEWPEIYPKIIAQKLKINEDDVTDHLMSEITEQCVAYYVLVDFFNLYCYNLLDFSLGKGMEELKYERKVFVNESLENKIRDKYEHYCDKLFTYIFKVLEANCYHEFGYIHNQEECYNDGIDYNEIVMHIPLHLRKKICKVKFSSKETLKKNFSYTDIETLFKIDELWESEYGGPLWGDGAEFLASAHKCKTIHDKFIWIDKVLDLYHNTGHILNKSIFNVLSFNDNNKCLTSFIGNYFTHIRGIDIRELENSEESGRKVGLKAAVNPLDLRADHIRKVSDYCEYYSKYFIDTFARNVIIANKHKIV